MRVSTVKQWSSTEASNNDGPFVLATDYSAIYLQLGDALLREQQVISRIRELEEKLRLAIEDVRLAIEDDRGVL